MCGSSFAQRQGFTLVEKLVALAILCILVGLGFYGFRAARQSADRIAGDAEAVIAKLEQKAPPPTRGSDSAPIPDQYLYVFQDGVVDVPAEVQRLATVASFKVLQIYTQTFKGFAAHADGQNHTALMKDPAIQGVEQDRKISIQTQQVPRGIQRINIDLGYAGTSDGSSISLKNQKRQGRQQSNWANINVAVLDTGIDSTHPDLNVAFSRGFVRGKANDVDDLHGHGTHVAGTIGAINNTLGVVGVAPGARLYNLKILDANGSGSFSDLIAGLDYVRTHANEIHVLNLSLGGPFSALVNRAVNSCVQAGVVVAVAAGNDAKPASSFSPASASGAITVGALADADGKSGGRGANTGFGPDDSFASFSNYGPQVKLLAPGVKIASTFPINKGGYAVLTGTSMASPHVAGLAVRIQNASMNPGAPGASLHFPGRRAGTRATPAEVFQVLQQTAGEKIKGRFDTLQYPVINAAGL